MRLTIDQHDLHSALSVVSRAVKGHPTMPSLGGVLLVLPVKLGDREGVPF